MNDLLLIIGQCTVELAYLRARIVELETALEAQKVSPNGVAPTMEVAVAVVSLQDYRSYFSQEAGPYIGPQSYEVRATGGSSTTQLVCDAYPIMSGIPVQDTLIDRPLYRPNATQQSDRNRYIMAYDPQTGTITPDLPWSVAPFSDAGGSTYGFLEAFTYADLEQSEYEDLEGSGVNGIGERFEVLGPFDQPTTTRLINEGLRHCWVIVEVACIPSILTSRHDLTLVAPWLIDPGNLLQVGLQAMGEDRNLRDPFERRIFGQVERDGGTFYLNTMSQTFNTGDTLWLRLLKRSYDHCRAAGGVYGEQQGLSLDTDEAVPTAGWGAAAALVAAWRQFGHLLEPAANQRLIRDQQSAVASFNDLVREHLVADMPQKKLYRRRSFGPAVRVAR